MSLSLYKIEYKRVCDLSDKERSRIEGMANLNNPEVFYFDEEDIKKLKKFKIEEGTDYVIL